jgi:putative ATP-binding cassette transporter
LLNRVGLCGLADRLDHAANWQQRLSLGEQQRLSIVRAVLLRPDWLLLDEATASLDEPAERMVYEFLREELPRASIVSVGHRSTLRALHTRHIPLVPGQLRRVEPASERAAIREESAAVGSVAA